jgi:4a-hydroxytetrahydrobiopterin dehydratase
MTDLTLQQCTSLSSDEIVELNHAETTALLQQLDPQWQLDTKAETINHTFIFENYYQTMAFANGIAQIAHQQDHHPELLLSYNRCTVTYSTHSIATLSIKDFICAAKINAAQNL